MSTPALCAVVVALWLACLAQGAWRAALPALLILALWRLRHDGADAAAQRLVAVLLLTALLGTALVTGRQLLLGRGPLAQLAQGGGPVEIEAVVVTEPRESEFGSWTVVRVVTLGSSTTRDRALLRLPAGSRVPALGQRLAFSASARTLQPAGFEGYVRRLSAGTELLPRSPVRVTRAAGPLLATTNAVRERARAAAARHLPPHQAALLTGLVTGDTEGQSRERAGQFEDAGLSHLVAVSGSNVALVLAGVLALSTGMGVGARGRQLSAIIAVAWFVVLVRAEPSVLRAAVMAVLALAAGLRGRGADARHSLAAAVLLLLLADPFLAGQLGFALSVAATAGVLVLGPMLARRVPGPETLRRLVGATLGAQLGVAPLLVALPGGAPIASVPANLLAVPLAAVASAVGIAAAIAAQLSIPVGGAVAVAARPPLAAIGWVAETFAAGPRVSARDASLPLAIVLAGALLARRRAPRLAVAAVVLVVCLPAAPAAGTGGRGAHRDGPRCGAGGCGAGRGSGGWRGDRAVAGRRRPRAGGSAGGPAGAQGPAAGRRRAHPSPCGPQRRPTRGAGGAARGGVAGRAPPSRYGCRPVRGADQEGRPPARHPSAPRRGWRAVPSRRRHRRCAEPAGVRCPQRRGQRRVARPAYRGGGRHRPAHRRRRGGCPAIPPADTASGGGRAPQGAAPRGRHERERLPRGRRPPGGVRQRRERKRLRPPSSRRPVRAYRDRALAHRRARFRHPPGW